MALQMLTGSRAAVSAGRAPADGLILLGVNAELESLKHKAELRSCLGSLRRHSSRELNWGWLQCALAGISEELNVCVLLCLRPGLIQCGL